MEAIFNSFKVIQLSQYHYYWFFLISILIYVSYIYQYFNTVSILEKKKKEYLNVDIIHGEVKYMLQDPKNAKLFFFPAMWILIIISMLSMFIFKDIGNKWIFSTMVILLVIQNMLNYSFIIKTALTVETKGISIKEAIEEREWTILRSTVKKIKHEGPITPEFIEKHLPGYTDIKNRNLIKYGLKEEEGNRIVSINGDYRDLYRIGDKIYIDTIDIALSQVFSELYKEYDLNKNALKSILEAFFVSMTLYLSLLIN